MPYLPDYYNKIPAGVINNRFTQRFELADEGLVSDNHFDFKTPEYTSFKEITQPKWEATRGIGYSFGYNRHEGEESYLSVEALVHSFVDIVSKNGNLLLNVGPMAYGTLPNIQRDRLMGLGAWLKVNGEAIFDTRPWLEAEGITPEGTAVRFTQKGDALYALLLGRPQKRRVSLQGLQAVEGTTVRLLGHDEALPWEDGGQHLMITLPERLPKPSVAYTLKISPQPDRLTV